MGVDKKYCMSSYLAFRFIERSNAEFYKGMTHRSTKPVPEEEKVIVCTAEEIDAAIYKAFDSLKGEKLGLMLSGGMDSAILASYMPKQGDVYTFRFLGGSYQQEELHRAEHYAEYCGLNLHYVDISWMDVEKYLPVVMQAKQAPVHAIEPQIYKAAVMAKEDGITKMAVGACSDLIFGGMDGLLAKDWDFDDFKARYIFTDPREVLADPEDMGYLFERYRDGNKIDFLKFLHEVSLEECAGSYINAFESAQMPYIDIYRNLKMAVPLDLQRIRGGESKYLIRELFRMKYPDMDVPEKIPMPRPVDSYFAEWKGPVRKEFKTELDMSRFTGNQKWQIYCLERFLNEYES